LTLPLVDTWNVRGLSGAKYTVGPRCAMPTCTRFADHAHHMVRRSQLGGDYNWVEIEGTLYANLVGLCAEHHDQVTGRVGGHKAAIRLLGDLFWWCELVENTMTDEIEYVPIATLDDQPPTPDSLAERASDESGPEHCPVCGQTTRRRRGATGSQRRRRKSWCILVPDDAEDGAAVLDTLVDDLAPLLGVTPDRTGRYFVIAPVLVFAQQHRHEFIESIKGR